MRDTWERCLAALCAWREARGEGDEGMRAVLHVINNRSQISGRSWEQEIVAKNQFSSMTIRGDSQTIAYPKIDDKRFESALRMAFEIYAHCDLDDPTDGATFYYNPVTATSKWFIDNIVNSPKYKISAIIKNHQFFKSRG